MSTTKKKKNVNRSPISYWTGGIRVTKSELNIPPGVILDPDLQPSPFKFALFFDIYLDKTNSLITIALEFKFLKDESAPVIFHLRVENIYKIGNFSEIVVNNKITPEPFLGHLLEMSLNQSRGVQSQIVKDTEMQKFLLPLFGAQDLLTRYSIGEV